MIINFLKHPQKLFPLLFFTAIFCLGLFIYKDYGVSFDEPAQRLIGATNLNHIAHTFQIQSIINNEVLGQFPKNLNQITDRDYGVIFEVPAAFMEHLFNLKQEREIYLARHLLTFLFFLAGLFSVHQMAVRRYSSWKIGLLAATFLILSPRIFADAFYNSKDLVFLSIFAVAMNSMIRFLIDTNWKNALLHGLICGIAIDVRVMAIIIPVLTASILIINYLHQKDSLKKIIGCGLIYILALVTFMILLWPYLWDNPFKNLVQALGSMAKFRHNPYLIFMGESVRASKLPWYYLPTWIGITTPIVYLGLFTIGSLWTIKNLFKNRFTLWKSNNEMQDLIFLSLFFGPILAIILLHSVLYNGWRHLFFVYPAFILISIGGLQQLWIFLKNKFARLTLLILMCITSANTAYWMIANHPLQNLYFNALSGNWINAYEVDYWGVANKQALERILQDTPNSTIIAWPGHGYQWPGGWQLPFIQNLKILSSSDLVRIRVPETKNESTYIITSMMGNDGNDTSSYRFNHRYKIVSEILVDQKPVLSIFKKLENPVLPPVKVGDVLHFSKKQMGTNYLISGWQDSEDWGTWSSGKESLLTIPLPTTKKERPQIMKISLRALINQNLPKQSLEIFLNGKLTKKVWISQAFNTELEIDIPSQTFNIDILIKHPDAAKPIDLGINEDVRQISIGVESAEFK